MRGIMATLASALLVLVASCDNMTGGAGGGAMLENARFIPNYPIEESKTPDLYMAPWKFGWMSSAIVQEKGGDGKQGFVALQRSEVMIGDNMERATWRGVLMQDLPAPIRAGRTYTISVSGSLSATVTGLGKVASSSAMMPVRFVAYNDLPQDFPLSWKQKPGTLVTIGEVNVRSKKWENYTVAEWVADADYSSFAMLVGDSAGDRVGEGCMGDVVFIDNVILQEKD